LEAEIKPGTFSLSPSDSMIADLARDYRAMTGMIFGNVPTFDQVIASVARLEHLVNS
jgi:hypothetical protein